MFNICLVYGQLAITIIYSDGVVSGEAITDLSSQYYVTFHNFRTTLTFGFIQKRDKHITRRGEEYLTMCLYSHIFTCS